MPTRETRAAGQAAAAALGEAMQGRGDPMEAYLVSERAAATQWREEIVVRVTQPPRAILLETDIPSLSPTSPRTSGEASPEDTRRPSSEDGQPERDAPPKGLGRVIGGGSGSLTTLRDGTPATPAEFKRRYNLLLEIGDRLRTGSAKFSSLYAEGEAEGWTVERLERWERLDERFRALVGEGWMVWSGAAFCLAVNPALHRNVEAKLGYVGCTERGWHELGVKTFLRHPEIMEVQPLRRELKEMVWKEL